ncbi:hypothetical protein BX592_111230 [Paraburkholderia rhizosphaerae]|uniref:Uncharacterized protein n=1 Tax=Paraburkholderia rhizosphaerae TaxID=480658 RepID=A0A4R8LRZ9_9BURK|nr:hypothetical protein BX592_111230 [Paraburkholderia rhizosphaerae]
MHPIGMYVSDEYVASTLRIRVRRRTAFRGRVRFINHPFFESMTYVCPISRDTAIEALANAVDDAEQLLVMARPTRLRR